MLHRFTLVATVATLTFACGGGDDDPVSVGENSRAKTGEFLSDYAASWVGYVEAYTFLSGSDRLRLTLDEYGKGYLEFGEQPLMPTPTDPDVGIGPPKNGFSSRVILLEGFRYSALQTTVEASRIQLGADKNECYAVWCGLQTSYPTYSGVDPEPSGYTCIDTRTVYALEDEVTDCYQQTSEGDVPLDCRKLADCIIADMPCTCDATACGVVLDTSDFGTKLDGALEDEGNTLVGTLVLEGERTTVRLQRQ